MDNKNKSYVGTLPASTSIFMRTTEVTQRYHQPNYLLLHLISPILYHYSPYHSPFSSLLTSERSQGAMLTHGPTTSTCTSRSLDLKSNRTLTCITMPHVVVNYMYYYFLHCDSALNFFIVWFKSVVLNEKVSLFWGWGNSLLIKCTCIGLKQTTVNS